MFNWEVNVANLTMAFIKTASTNLNEIKKFAIGRVHLAFRRLAGLPNYGRGSGAT